MASRFAAIVPVDSTPIGLWRGQELIRSLLRWEPDLAWCVVLEDSVHSHGLTQFAEWPATCHAVTFASPIKNAGRYWIGALTAAILRGLAWVQSHTQADFVLRIDTDALVIAPFASFIKGFCERSPDAGVLGVIGGSCNPQEKLHLSPEPRILQAYRQWPLALSLRMGPSGGGLIGTTIDGQAVQQQSGRVTVTQLRAFDALRSHIRAAIANGYCKNEDCQGGACVVTRRMIDRMSEKGYLNDSTAWACLPFPDDQVLAMYAHAAGLRLFDCSQPGEPFGVQYARLAYPPQQLVSRGYSLIHSVRNDPDFSESVIRAFFRARAATPPLADDRIDAGE